MDASKPTDDRLRDVDLERSEIVANSRMNRERHALGDNSYERELGLNPVAFLAQRTGESGSAAWLDLCCGRGLALIQAAAALANSVPKARIELHGVDLVDMFAPISQMTSAVAFTCASIHAWSASRTYDLITCVHGLHYIGDKLDLLARALTWLSPDGVFLAHLDLDNLRSADGTPLRRRLLRYFKAAGVVYHTRRRLVECHGPRELSFALRYVGADDQSGPNCTGQDAVTSYYAVADPTHLAADRESAVRASLGE